jgi:hypothetical protein
MLEPADRTPAAVYEAGEEFLGQPKTARKG